MKKSIILALTCGLTLGGFAQSITPSVFNSAGGSRNAGYYTLEWSIGEMSLVNQVSPNRHMILSHGFLQPFITVNPGTPNDNNIDRKIKIFPVPATRFVEVNFFIKEQGKLLMRLYDATGKIMYMDERWHFGLDLIEKIPLHSLKNGTYILKIDMPSPNGGQPVFSGTYEIIKI